jgi:hypothetical protein
VRACDQRILAQGDIGSAVATDVGHDGSRGVVVARVAADGGTTGGRNLIFLARHFFLIWYRNDRKCGSDLGGSLIILRGVLRRGEAIVTRRDC